MKKICVLLGIVFEFSISVTNATSDMSGFDDCDHALDSSEQGLKAPTNSPQVWPASDEAKIPSDSFAAKSFLPASNKRLEVEAGMQTDVPDRPQDEGANEGVAEKDEKQDSVHEADGSTGVAESVDSSNESNDAQTLELHIYDYEQDGDWFILKRQTLEDLKASCDSLQPGQTYVATFKPSIYLAIDGEVTSHLIPHSSWDTFPVIAKIRAWTKWWLNPYAWWDSSYYSLSYHESKIDWDVKNNSPTLITNHKKDTKYLLSQLGMFLYSQGGSKYMNPYIVPETRLVFDSAMKLRFNRVEKAAYERVGFKNVRIGTRVNPVSHHVEYCILAEK